MEPFYLLAENDYSWQQTIKKSDFIVSFFRIESEEQAQTYIDQISKKHHKATHNVFAYVIGDNDEIKRYSDNGEPSGTAGVPMLEVFQKRQVHNILAIITRYFGGIKLGAGGLIRAYAGTVAQGLDEAGLVERLWREKIQIDIDYQNNDQLTYWLKQEDYPVFATDFDTAVHHQVAVAPDQVKAFEEELKNRFAGQVSFQKIGETYLEIPAK